MAEEQQRRWVGSMPAAYARGLVPTVFLPFAEDLAGRVAASAPPSPRVLELAAGTGVLTAQLLTRLPVATVTATDLNDGMVALGREAAPDATWRTADAMALPFDDETFDVVVCQFGVMFFPDRVAAYAEARRVLRPGGRFLANAWGPLAEHDFERNVVAAVQRVRPDDPPRFFEEVVHGYADPGVFQSDLAAAGYSPVAVQSVRVEGRSPSAAQLAAGYARGTPLFSAFTDGSEGGGPDVEVIEAAVAEELTARFGAGPITGSMTAVVASAEAPA
jgi:SAM-dependent methyltransferase